MLRDYYDYINEANLTPEEIEKMKKDSLSSHMRLYLSKELATILKRMDDPDGIVNDLLTLSRRPVQFDISFVDKTDKNDGVSYIQTRKAKEFEEKKGLNLGEARNDYSSEVWTSNQRRPSSIGRLVKKIFVDKYTAKQIEDFVNEYKAKFEEKDDKIKLVFGEEIRNWYNHTKYVSGDGTLNKSCMRGEDKQRYLDIYCKNPDEVGMVILLDDRGRLLGRAIVWLKVYNLSDAAMKGPFKTGYRGFMDRIYTVYDHDFNTFKDYAKRKGWLHKAQQSYSNSSFIDTRDGAKYSYTLTTKLKPKKYDAYPWLDTMCYYTPDTGRLSTSRGKYGGYKRYFCQSTGGGAEAIPDN